MLLLVSSAMPRLTGTRSALKCVIGCSLAVLEDAEILLAQPADESAAGVGHRRGDVDQLHGAAELEPLRSSFGGWLCCAPSETTATAASAATIATRGLHRHVGLFTGYAPRGAPVRRSTCATG